jgi:hypothetical protein
MLRTIQYNVGNIANALRVSARMYFVLVLLLFVPFLGRFHNA